MTFFSAIILGLIASAHCAGMCGGLQMALQSSDPKTLILRSKSQAFVHLLLMNTGRIVTYILAGVLFASIGYAVFGHIDIPTISAWLRGFTGLLIFIIGFQLFLQNQRPFRLLEPLGAALWQRVSRTLNQSGNRKRWSFMSGLVWGFLPCGLVYSVLVTTVFSNDVLSAGLVMFGFGLGTMPSLILTGLIYKRFRDFVSLRSAQMAGGLFFMLGGTLILSAPLWVNMDFMGDYPQLINLVFCVS